MLIGTAARGIREDADARTQKPEDIGSRRIALAAVGGVGVSETVVRPRPEEQAKPVRERAGCPASDAYVELFPPRRVRVDRR